MPPALNELAPLTALRNAATSPNRGAQAARLGDMHVQPPSGNLPGRSPQFPSGERDLGQLVKFRQANPPVAASKPCSSASISSAQIAIGWLDRRSTHLGDRLPFSIHPVDMPEQIGCRL